MRLTRSAIASRPAERRRCVPWVRGSSKTVHDGRSDYLHRLAVSSPTTATTSAPHVRHVTSRRRPRRRARPAPKTANSVVDGVGAQVGERRVLQRERCVAASRTIGAAPASKRLLQRAAHSTTDRPQSDRRTRVEAWVLTGRCQRPASTRGTARWPPHTPRGDQDRLRDFRNTRCGNASQGSSEHGCSPWPSTFRLTHTAIEARMVIPVLDPRSVTSPKERTSARSPFISTVTSLPPMCVGRCRRRHVMINTEVGRVKYKAIQAKPQRTLAIWKSDSPYSYARYGARLPARCAPRAPHTSMRCPRSTSARTTGTSRDRTSDPEDRARSPTHSGPVIPIS